jgi:hypothetical protein
MDDQTTGSCPTCGRRDPRTPQLCDVDRSKLRSWLFDIPTLHAELQERIEERSAPSDLRVAVTVTEWDVEAKRAVRVPATVGRPADPTSYYLPSGASSSASRGGPVTGSKERRLPIDTDAVDLTGQVRSAGVAVLDEDAVGYESVASVLDFWVEDWRADRGAGERRPAATVPEIARWLLDRLDDACDDSPAIAEFFDAVRQLRGALQAKLGQVVVPDYKRGIPCPQCQCLTLVHHDGSDRIECASCPALLSFIEYDAHVRSLSSEHEQARRVKVAQIKAVRGLLLALRGAGWRHNVCRYGDEEGVLVVHQWRRGTASVDAWVQDVDGQLALSGVAWAADAANPSVILSATGDWVTTYGIPALTKLARAAGILTPVKQKEKAA